MYRKQSLFQRLIDSVLRTSLDNAYDRALANDEAVMLKLTTEHETLKAELEALNAEFKTLKAEKEPVLTQTEQAYDFKKQNKDGLYNYQRYKRYRSGEFNKEDREEE